jgi:redox-sensing transcriptional repressor
VLSGTRIYPVEKFAGVISGQYVKTGILAVPAQEAQITANLMVDNGIKGILNFAPVRLLVPPSIFVENMNLRATLEKVAWFADK